MDGQKKELSIDYAIAKQNPNISFFKLGNGEKWEMTKEIEKNKYLAGSAAIIEENKTDFKLHQKKPTTVPLAQEPLLLPLPLW